MKLELKHLAPYLPYGLRMKSDTKTLPLIGFQGQLILLNENTYCVSSMVDETFWLPILRPLSDLTKEIEVNGEKFVPMTIISGMEDFEHYFEYLDMFKADSPLKFEMINVFWKNTEFNNEQKAFTKFELWRFSDIRFDHAQKLFEWHFDVFGLIKEGLAIDINTL